MGKKGGKPAIDSSENCGCVGVSKWEREERNMIRANETFPFSSICFFFEILFLSSVFL